MPASPSRACGFGSRPDEGASGARRRKALRRADNDLAVDYEARRGQSLQHSDKFGKIAPQRLAGLGAQIDGIIPA